MSNEFIRQEKEEISKLTKLSEEAFVAYIKRLKPPMSILINEVLPEVLATMVSDYAIISKEEFLQINNQLVQAVKDGDFERIEEAIENGADINFNRISYGESPLMMAILVQDASMVKFLIQKGANVNDDISGETPLIKAVKEYSYLQMNSHGYNNNKTSIIKLLLAAGASVNAENKDGDTALVQADDEIKDLLLGKNVESSCSIM